MDKHEVLSVRIPSDLKKDWEIYCRAGGKSSSEVVRAVIRRLLSKSTSGSATEVISDCPDHLKTRIEVRLSQSEREAVLRIAKDAGYSPNRWIADLVRAYVTRDPQFGLFELQAVGESNNQLRAIGRNLNRIALAINRGGNFREVLSSVRELKVTIDQHTSQVHAVVQSNLERWKVTWL